MTVSATTRDRRPGEEDGRDYWFLDPDEFLARIESDAFLEHVVYVSGHRYGTLRSELERIRESAATCRCSSSRPRAPARARRRIRGAVTIFISAAVDELERRLRERATESTGEIGERIALARAQLEEAGASTTSSRTTIWSGPSRSSRSWSAACSLLQVPSRRR